MTTWGVSMMKDEADVACSTLLHLASEGCAGIVVADNLSTDSTRRELEVAALELEGRCEVVIVDDREPGYYQAAKMTRLAAMAAERGATWIVPFDADELWCGLRRPLARELDDSPLDVVTVSLRYHYRTGLDPSHSNPFESMVWRGRDFEGLAKVAFRWRDGAAVHMGNHGVDLPGAKSSGTLPIEIRHFPYRSVEHFTRKALNGSSAYRASDLPDMYGAHWRGWGDLADAQGVEALGDVFEEHYWHPDPTASLVCDPAPFLRW